MRHTIIRLILLLACFSLIATACTLPAEDKGRPAADIVEPAEGLKKISGWSVPAFDDDMSMESLYAAVEKSFEYYGRLEPNQRFHFGKDSYTALELQDFLKDFVNIMASTSPGSPRRDQLVDRFEIYKGGYGKEGVLFTGYYVPLIYGSRLPGIDYTVPLYSLPRDIITVDLGLFKENLRGIRIVGRYQGGSLLPYYSRREIDRQGVLNGRGCEIVWIKDPADAFFLQIQGSGKVILPDKSVLFLHYAGSNGYPYRSIGKLLMDEGKIPAHEMSMQSLKRYLKENPQDQGRILDYNESYVFFETATGGVPVGSLNVPITPGRSIAADQSFYPPGSIAYIKTEEPVLDDNERLTGWKQINRFVLVQDKGGAIRGPNRADLFWGEGDEAGRQAGWMNRTGEIFFIAPKPRTDTAGAEDI